MKKKIISILLLMALFSAFACCAGAESLSVSGENVTIGDLALRADGAAGKLYENDGLKLLIPLEYEDLLLTETPQADEDGILFTVSEKASVEAAKKTSSHYDGAGWLFSIGRIDEGRRQDLLCYTDLSGTEIFAKDADGYYYVYAHPTDVRFERETVEQMYEDQEQWTMLNGWAWNDVRSSFVAENTGLSAVRQGNTDIDLYLARMAYMPGVHYTVSTTQFGPLEPEAGAFNAAPYLAKLMEGVYTPVHDEEAPDGEYVVLNFPDDRIRFDFFFMEGAKNMIRQVWSDGYEMLYKAEFEDETVNAADVMQQWYHDLAAQKGLRP